MDLRDNLLRLMFPSGMLDYFTIVKVSRLYKDGGVEVELEENPAVPLEFSDRELYLPWVS